MPGLRVWLRSPLFDHGSIGVTIRTPRPSRDRDKKAIEAIFKLLRECTAAPVSKAAPKGERAIPPFDAALFASAAGRLLGWQAGEAELLLNVFEAMWNVEVAQNVPDVRDSPALAKWLRLAQFLVVQLYERPRRVSSLDSFNALSSSALDSSNNVVEASAAVVDEDPRLLIQAARKTEWAQRLNFARRVIKDVVRAMRDLHAFLTGTLTSTSVPSAIVDALGFMLAGTKDSVRVSRLSQVVPSSLATVEDLCAWLEARVGLNESRSPQWWAASSASAEDEDEEPSLSSSTPTVVRGAMPRDVIVLPRLSDAASLTSTFFATCRGAIVSCLSRSTYAHVIGCTDTTIYLGSVRGIVTIEHCERVRVVACCGMVRVVNSTDVHLNVWTGAAPLLVGDCRGVWIGPHSARYPDARNDALGVCPAGEVTEAPVEEQKWRKPVILDAGGIEEQTEELHDVFMIQPPADFLLEPAPYWGSSTQGSPVVAPHLPADYAARLEVRRGVANETLQLIRESGDSAAMHAAFRDWLAATGNLDELIDLARAESSLRGDAPPQLTLPQL